MTSQSRPTQKFCEEEESSQEWTVFSGGEEEETYEQAWDEEGPYWRIKEEDPDSEPGPPIEIKEEPLDLEEPPTGGGQAGIILPPKEEPPQEEDATTTSVVATTTTSTKPNSDNPKPNSDSTNTEKPKTTTIASLKVSVAEEWAKPWTLEEKVRRWGLDETRLWPDEIDEWLRRRKEDRKRETGNAAAPAKTPHSRQNPSGQAANPPRTGGEKRKPYTGPNTAKNPRKIGRPKIPAAEKGKPYDKAMTARWWTNKDEDWVPPRHVAKSATSCTTRASAMSPTHWRRQSAPQDPPPLHSRLRDVMIRFVVDASLLLDELERR